MEFNEDTKIVEVDNVQIAKMAFFKLYHDEKKDSALRLANCILSHNCINLSINDIDWDIEMAFNYCGGHPQAGRRYLAMFNFKGKTKMPEEHCESLIKEFYG